MKRSGEDEMRASVRGATANQVKQKDERGKEEKDGRRDGAKRQGRRRRGGVGRQRGEELRHLAS